MQEEFRITKESQKAFLVPIFIRLVFILAGSIFLVWSQIFVDFAVGFYLLMAYYFIWMLGLPLVTYFNYLGKDEDVKYSFDSVRRKLSIYRNGQIQTVAFKDILEVHVYAGVRKTYNRYTEEGWSEDYYYRIKIKDRDDIVITSLTGIPHNLMGFPVEVKRHFRLLRIVI